VLPTPVLGGGWALHHFNLTEDQYGDLHVFGVLENLTGQAEEYPTVYVTFRDASGAEVGSDFNSVEVEILPAGWRAPFHIVTNVDEYATIEMSVEALPATEAVRTDLTLSNVQVTLDGGLYEVRGDIRNPGAPLADIAEIAAALLDASGKTIGVGYTVVLDIDLGSGQTASFRIEVDEFFGTASDFRIVAVGY
jgi:hypothetical protein